MRTNITISRREEERKCEQKTYVTGVGQTSRQVKLRIWPPWKHIRDRSTGRIPAAECGSGIPIGQLPLKGIAPPFSISGGTTVDHGPIQLANIVPDITTSPNVLSGELIFSDT